jgi:hypothetical protein
MTALDETRTATGEVAAADRTMVTATSLADSRTPRARGRQRAPLWSRSKRQRRILSPGVPTRAACSLGGNIVRFPFGSN